MLMNKQMEKNNSQRSVAVRYIITLLLCLQSLIASAQQIQRDYNQVSMSEVLIDLNKASEKYQISFIYNELEDFTVTKKINAGNVVDAIKEAVGFYPIRIVEHDSVILVECMQKTTGKIIGRVVDSNSQPLPYCNISVLRPDSTFITGGVSNENGDFVIPCDTYPAIVKFSSVGYKTACKNTNNGDVRTVRLSAATYMINGVVVKGERPQYQSGKEGLLTNIDGTVLSEVGTALDVLQLLPGVTVNDDAVSVRGHGTPILYINSRKVYDSKELRQLNSKDIKSIEIITNPGAKYDATVASVIKIITKKKAGDGWGGEVYATGSWSSHRNSYGSVTELNYRNGGLDIGGSVELVRYKGYQTQTSEYNIYNVMNKISNHVWTWRMSWYKLKFNVNYEFNANHAIGAQYLYKYSKDKEDLNDFICNNHIIFNDGSEQDMRVSQNTVRGKDKPHTFNAYYNGKVGDLHIAFDADMLLSKNYNYDSKAVSYNSVYDHNVEVEYNYNSKLFATKLVLSYPIWKGSLDAGTENTLTKRTQKYQLTGDVDNITDDDIKERTTALFAEYSAQIGNFQTTAGLRYEHNKTRYKQFGILNDELSRTYNQFFPSASVSYGQGKFSSRLSFTMKTVRPFYSALSSNLQYGDDYQYQGGNPYLKPTTAKILGFELRYDFLAFNAEYRNERNSLLQLDELYGDKAILMKYQNVKNMNQINLLLSASKKIGFWTPSYSVGMIGTFFDLREYGIEHNKSKPLWYFELYNHFQLPWKISLRADFSLNTGKKFGIAYFYGWNDLTFRLQRSFLKDRLTVKMMITNVFNKNYDDFKWNGRYSFCEVHKDNEYRRFRIDISYRFNMPKSKYKGTGAGNDEKRRL